MISRDFLLLSINRPYFETLQDSIHNSGESDSQGKQRAIAIELSFFMASMMMNSKLVQQMRKSASMMDRLRREEIVPELEIGLYRAYQ